MKTSLDGVTHEINALADDARHLLSATADVAGEKVCEARQRVTAALERSREVLARARNQAVEGARMVDSAVHEHTYPAIAVGVGIGALIGYLLAQRSSR